MLAVLAMCSCSGFLPVSPMPGATDVPINAQIAVGTLLHDGDVLVATATGEPVAGSIQRVGPYQDSFGLVLTPSAPLSSETEYVVSFRENGLGTVFELGRFVTGTEVDTTAPPPPQVTSLIAVTGPIQPNSCHGDELDHVQAQVGPNDGAAYYEVTMAAQVHLMPAHPVLTFESSGCEVPPPMLGVNGRVCATVVAVSATGMRSSESQLRCARVNGCSLIESGGQLACATGPVADPDADGGPDSSGCAIGSGQPAAWFVLALLMAVMRLRRSR